MGCRRSHDWEGRYRDAQLKFQNGSFDDALRLAEETDRELANPNSVWSWKFRLLKAEMLLWKGAPPERVLGLLASDPPAGLPPDIVVRRSILGGRALCGLTKHAEAEAAFKEAERRIKPAEPGLEAELAFARGKCVLSADPVAAKAYYQKAADLATGIDPFVAAGALNDVGYLYLQIEHYDEAIENFKRVLALTDSLLLQEKALGNLGYAYAEQGDFKRAIDSSGRAEAIASQVAEHNNQAAWTQYDREAWLIDLGKAHYALWQLPEAETSYRQALGIAQQLQDSDSAALCFHNLALNALRMNAPANAEEYTKEGESYHSAREQVHLAFDRAEIAAAHNRWTEAERLFEDLAQNPKIEPLLRGLAQRDLGKTYWQDGKPGPADREFREGIHTFETAMASIQRDEERLSFLDQERFYDDYINFLVAQHRSAEALGVAEEGHHQVEANDKNRKPAAAVLPEAARFVKRQDQVVLFYSVTDEETHLFVITPSGFEHFKLQGHRALQLKIEACNVELENHPEVENSPAARTLYEAIIQPAEKLIPKNARVIIIPSKVLSWVSFESLVVPAPHPHYWIEDVNIRVAGNLAGMTSSTGSHGRQTYSKEILVMGAPIEVTKEYPALKDAESEMRLVLKHFPAGQQTTISGKAATPEAYALAAPGNYRLVHLDTHGTASDLSPLDSAIILSPGNGSTFKLYAREIKDIPLHSDLVTISACYGAGSRWYNTEGVVGLGWAFLRAGAHQVIAGLWEADGAATAQLMDDFYGELTQGKSATEALRDAKLKMLHSKTFYRHPYYWASLQLYTGS